MELRSREGEFSIFDFYFRLSAYGLLSLERSGKTAKPHGEIRDFRFTEYGLVKLENKSLKKELSISLAKAQGAFLRNRPWLPRKIKI